MNRPGTIVLRSAAAGTLLFVLLAGIPGLSVAQAQAQQLGHRVGAGEDGWPLYRIDANEVTNIGAGEIRTNGNPDRKSEFYGVRTDVYGTINVLNGGQLKTNYMYCSDDDPIPSFPFHVWTSPLFIMNSGTLIVQKGGLVFNQGAIRDYGYIANYGTWNNWYHLAMGETTEPGQDNPTPRIDNYGTINNMNKYGLIHLVRGVFNNYGEIENNGTIVLQHYVDSRPGHYNDPYAPVYFINHPGAVMNVHKTQWWSQFYMVGGNFINNGTVTFDPGTTIANMFAGKFINNSIVNNFGSFSSQGFHDYYWYTGLPVPASVPSSYFENNGTWYNRPGSVFTTYYTASMVNNGTFINQGRIEFTAGQFTGYDGYAAKPQVNDGKPGYFKNYGLLRNDGEIVLRSAVHGSEFVIRSDGWSDITHTKETGPGMMTNYGLITGKGSIDGIVINELNGIVAPGDSIGTMTITGNYTNNPGSYLEIEVDEKSSDKLIVAGTATLNGGKVTPVYSGIFARNIPYTYTFLTAAGGVAGSFAGVVNNSTFFDFYLSYFPTSVDLTLKRRGFETICETENQCAVADGLERAYPVATGDMRDVFNALLNLNAYQARGAFDQMGGLIHTAIPAVTFLSFNQYRDMMTARMSGFLPGGAASMLGARFPVLASRTDSVLDAPVNLPATGSAAPTKDSRSLPWGVWLEAYGGLGERRANDISSRYDQNTTGVILGFDRMFGSSLLLGGSLGYSNTRITMKDLSEDARMASYIGSLYGIWTKGSWYVNGIAGYGYNKYDTNREMNFGTISRSADASYSGHLLTGYVEGGYIIKMTYVDLIPRISFQATQLWRDGFSEDGAGSLSLDADRETVSSYLGSLGVTVRKDYATAAGIVSPELRVRWDHELSNDNHVLNASFSGYHLSAFTVMADRPDRDRLGVGLGLTLKMPSNLYFSLYYDGYLSNDTTQHSGMLGIQYKW